MKKVECIVRPHLMEAVKTALQDVGVVGMTVSEVKGFGRQKGHTETYRGSEYKVEFLPKVKIEVALSEELVDPAVEAVLQAARGEGINNMSYQRWAGHYCPASTARRNAPSNCWPCALTKSCNSACVDATESCSGKATTIRYVPGKPKPRLARA